MLEYDMDPVDPKMRPIIKTRNRIWHSPLRFLNGNRRFIEGNDFTCKSPPSVIRMFSAWRWRSASSKIRAPPKNKMPHDSGQTQKLDGRKTAYFVGEISCWFPSTLIPKWFIKKLLLGILMAHFHLPDPDSDSDFDFELQTKWLQCSMQNVSYSMEPDLDSHPKCQLQNC